MRRIARGAQLAFEFAVGLLAFVLVKIAYAATSWWEHRMGKSAPPPPPVPPAAPGVPPTHH
jgi:hypothetical protein